MRREVTQAIADEASRWGYQAGRFEMAENCDVLAAAVIQVIRDNRDGIKQTLHDAYLTAGAVFDDLADAVIEWIARSADD